jgi:ATP-dependent Lhr-like helicase
VLTGEEPQRLLLLAGRSWLVKEIEWSKRIVWLEAAKEGGKARWMGGARSLSREVCQGIRAALIGGASPAVHLSQRGKIELATLMDEIAVSSDAHFMSGSVTLPHAHGPSLARRQTELMRGWQEVEARMSSLMH